MDWASSQLDKVVLTAVGLDERVWETQEPAELLVTTVPELQQLAAEAVDLLDGLLERLEENRAKCATDWSALDDFAFMARWDIRRRLGKFSTDLGGCDRWKLLARCSSMRRRIVKSLCEVERVRCSILSIPFRFEGNYRNDRNIAIATRSAYRAFITGIRSISAKLAAEEIDLDRALRLGAAAMAVLIGQDIYAELRIEDREQLRGLQERLFDAARSEKRFSQRRVWADIEAFAELLAGVERRAELLSHDYELVCEALGRLAGLRPDETIEPTWMDRLTLLEGRDPQLDVVLGDSSPKPSTASRLGPPLLGLATELGRTLGRCEHERQRTALASSLKRTGSPMALLK